MKIKHPQNYISHHQKLNNRKLNLIDDTLSNLQINVSNLNVDSKIGTYNSTLPAYLTGSNIYISCGEDGAILNRPRCQSQALADNISNTKELPLSCAGQYITTPVVPFVFNGSTWDRLRGNTDGLINVNIIKQKRNEDKCFGITVNGGATSSTDADFILWNPAGSGVNLYVYHLSYSFVGTVSVAGQRKIGVELINAFTASGGLALGPVEMKFNTTANTNQAICYYSGNTSTRWRSLQDDYFYCDTTKNNFHIDLKLETDILEIAEGYGLRIQQDGTPDAGMRLNTQIRWYEE